MSQHPDAATAVGEVVGQVLEALGDTGQPPDLALLFVTAPHVAAMADVAAAVTATLAPVTLLGATAVSVVGGPHEVERGPAVSLWAGYTGAVTPFHLSVVSTPDGPTFTGWPDLIPDDSPALLLLTDPFSFAVDALLDRLGEDRPGLAVVGGMASAARGPGGNRLVVDAQVVTEGAVGAFLGPATSRSPPSSPRGVGRLAPRSSSPGPRGTWCTSWPGGPPWIASKRWRPRFPTMTAG
ncbi:MAG: hypothetical protein M3011_13570 [Actinomycetota bacterium]|nr:hypothetical protein [Actinomycetota bacterium]